VSYSSTFLSETAEIAKRLDVAAIEAMAAQLADVRERDGRVFVLGVGGGAGHASHAVCDFRKVAGIEAYTPADNVSELTARINDDGWVSALAGWLRVSKLSAQDCVFVFSVGGGDEDRDVSANVVEALRHAKGVGATICGVVGRDGGFTAQVADACVVVPTVSPERVTAHTESFQAVVWHLLVGHPLLGANQMRWEALEGR
jgi:D-sedoheptulose 7-phosphate isomerase